LTDQVSEHGPRFPTCIRVHPREVRHANNSNHIARPEEPAIAIPSWPLISLSQHHRKARWTVTQPWPRMSHSSTVSPASAQRLRFSRDGLMIALAAAGCKRVSDVVRPKCRRQEAQRLAPLPGARRPDASGRARRPWRPSIRSRDDAHAGIL